jgi:hypothetical protein
MSAILNAFEPLATMAPRQTPSRDDRRSRMIARMELAVEEAVNEEITLIDEDDRQLVECWGALCQIGGRFCYAGDDTLDIELNDDEAAAWYIDRPTSFTGNYQGCDWEATVRKHIRRGRSLRLTLDIEAK